MREAIFCGKAAACFDSRNVEKRISRAQGNLMLHNLYDYLPFPRDWEHFYPNAKVGNIRAKSTHKQNRRKAMKQNRSKK